MMTTSPLYPYINCSGLYYSTQSMQVSPSNGRLGVSASQQYYLKLFLRRAQSNGTDSGSKDVPVNGQSNIMPGYSGSSFIYRGYVLQYNVLPTSGTYDLNNTVNLSGLTMTDVESSNLSWLTPSGSMQILFGDISQVINCKVIVSSGVYGSQGIDQVIASEIKGVPITLLGGNYAAR